MDNTSVHLNFLDVFNWVNQVQLLVRLRALVLLLSLLFSEVIKLIFRGFCRLLQPLDYLLQLNRFKKV